MPANRDYTTVFLEMSCGVFVTTPLLSEDDKMDDDTVAIEQALSQEIVFLRNLFRVVVLNDTLEARHEIATQILLVSSQLNDCAYATH